MNLGMVTKSISGAYIQNNNEPTMFLTSLFKVDDRSFHKSEEVEIDVRRNDSTVATVVADISAGYNVDVSDPYNVRTMTPPVYREGIHIGSDQLIRRGFGENPFDNPNFRERLTEQFLHGMRAKERKIRRAIELQASQVLQDGRVTLSDGTRDLFTLDYKADPSLRPTAAVSWATATGEQIENDIKNTAKAVHDRSGLVPDQLLMGEGAFDRMISSESLVSKFKERRLDQGTISPIQVNSEGGQYRGQIEIGNNRFDIWTYSGQYDANGKRSIKRYLRNGSVVVRASAGELFASFGDIPHIGRELGITQSLLPELPRRFSGNGVDMHTNVWLSQDGESLLGGVSTRPLLIPVDIDAFGCLNTQLVD